MLTLAGHNGVRGGLTTGACGSSVVRRQLRDGTEERWQRGYCGAIIHRCSTVGLSDLFSRTKTELFLMCNLVPYPPCADKPFFHPRTTTASTCRPPPPLHHTPPTSPMGPSKTGTNGHLSPRLELFQENLSPLV